MKKILTLISAFTLASLTFAGEASHGLSLYTNKDLKYKQGQPYDHANPDAPKGGTVNLADFGAFTKFNPVSMSGVPAPQLGLVFETLMDGSVDIEEHFSQYGRLAESVQLADDRLSITYFLNKNAKFSDGKPVTADDVVFSYNLINEPGYNPAYKSYFSDIKQTVKIDDYTVKLEFEKYNQELPLIVGQVSILPKHIYDAEGKNFDKDFDNVLPVGSGPYTVDKFDKSKFISYKRNKEYWGKDITVNKGRYNFDNVTVKIFTDMLALRENVKAGNIDASMVMVAKDWAKFYVGEKIEKNHLFKTTFPSKRVAGMQSFALNLRRPVFKDRNLRKVIALLMDFEYMNGNMFYNQYTRLTNYFDNNEEMMSRGPAEGEEKALLEALMEKYGKEFVPTSAITKGPQVLGYDKTGKPLPIEKRIAGANKMLDRLGWKFNKESGVRKKGDQELSFTFMISDQNWVRIANSFINNLKQVGINAEYQLVQPAEFVQKRIKYDYDIITATFGGTQSPGNEQRSYLGSKSADIEGENNYCGIKNPAVDELVNNIIEAKSRKELVKYTHALDRILCANHYVVPQWYLDKDRFVYWNKFSGPSINAGKSYISDNFLNWWWYDEAKAEKLKQAMESNSKID